MLSSPPSPEKCSINSTQHCGRCHPEVQDENDFLSLGQKPGVLVQGKRAISTPRDLAPFAVPRVRQSPFTCPLDLLPACHLKYFLTCFPGYSKPSKLFIIFFFGPLSPDNKRENLLILKEFQSPLPSSQQSQGPHTHTSQSHKATNTHTLPTVCQALRCSLLGINFTLIRVKLKRVNFPPRSGCVALDKVLHL